MLTGAALVGAYVVVTGLMYVAAVGLWTVDPLGKRGRRLARR